MYQGNDQTAGLSGIVIANPVSDEHGRAAGAPAYSVVWR
jgi:hypothetical protein